jgi:hypothetical protein
MDSVIVTVPAVIRAHTITLPDAPLSATLTIHRTAPDRLHLSGRLDGRAKTD